MDAITVYRVDSASESWVPVGRIVERRRAERGDNLIGMVRLARKVFAGSGETASRIAIDDVEARRVLARLRERVPERKA